MAVVNTLAYFDMATITPVKSFITLTPGGDPQGQVVDVVSQVPQDGDGFHRYLWVNSHSKIYLGQLSFINICGSILIQRYNWINCIHRCLWVNLHS